MTALLRDRRFLVLLALGFSAGVPLPLVAGQVLRQWFAETGLSLGAIGMTALIGLAYANKFLWSPALDALRPPALRRLGHRRGWLLLIQLLLAATICGVGLTDPATGAGATVALLASGAGTLLLVGRIGWDGAYAAAAALMGVGVAATLLGPEPRRDAAVGAAPVGWAARLRASVVEPFLQFTRRRHWLAILLFISLFKLGEALAGLMTTPFYRSLGFTREDVATVGTVFGMAATLAGALVGGWLVPRLGTGRALVLTGLGQMLSNLMYVALYHAGHSMPMLWAQVGVESFTDGLADAAFLTYLSGLTSRAFTATQYALLSSLAAVPLRTLGVSSGWLAEWLGWPNFFLLTTAAALPAMGIMLWLLRRLPATTPPAPAAASAVALPEEARP